MSNQQGYNGGKLYSTRSRPVLIEGSFTVNATSSPTGVQNVTGANIENIFMISNVPSPDNPFGNGGSGYVWIKLNANYPKFLGGFQSIAGPPLAGTFHINSTQLTVGQPYLISTVGSINNGQILFTTPADSNGSLASKYFLLYDQYGNTFVVWFSVSGLGSYPSGVAGTLVEVALDLNDPNATVASKLSDVLGVLPSGLGTNSFGVAGLSTNTFNLISTLGAPLAYPMTLPQDASTPFSTGITFVNSIPVGNSDCWQAVGVPKGLTPRVGLSFVATSVGLSTGGGSNGTVQLPGSSTTLAMEIVGDPQLTLNPVPQGGSANVGGWIMMEFKNQASNFVYNSDTPADSEIVDFNSPERPADGTDVYFSFYVDASDTENGNSG